MAAPGRREPKAEENWMPKNDPTKALRKRLQKIEKSHARLSALTARIGAQRETISDLIALAHAFVVEGVSGVPPATTAARAEPTGRTPAARSRSARAVKRTAAKPAAARAVKRTTAKPTAGGTAKRPTVKRTTAKPTAGGTAKRTTPKRTTAAPKRTTAKRTAAKPTARRKPAAAPPAPAT
jgi:hypothetical protein